MADTCNSTRFCKNHKYNTEGLFSAQYNDNSSLHCGQENIKLFDYTKMNGGAAITDNVRVNVASGDYELANNGPYFQDIYTEEDYANGRNSIVSSMSVVNQAKNPRREKFCPEYTDFTSKSSPYLGLSSSGRSTNGLNGDDDQSLGDKIKEGFINFGEDLSSPVGCVIMGIIAGIIVIIIIWMYMQRKTDSYETKYSPAPLYSRTYGGLGRSSSYRRPLQNRSFNKPSLNSFSPKSSHVNKNSEYPTTKTTDGTSPEVPIEYVPDEGDADVAII